jgi:hypothetical protein
MIRVQDRPSLAFFSMILTCVVLCRRYCNMFVTSAVHLARVTYVSCFFANWTIKSYILLVSNLLTHFNLLFC